MEELDLERQPLRAPQRALRPVTEIAVLVVADLRERLRQMRIRRLEWTRRQCTRQRRDGVVVERRRGRARRRKRFQAAAGQRYQRQRQTSEDHFATLHTIPQAGTGWNYTCEKVIET